MTYMFTLFFAISAVLSTQRRQVYAVVVLLGLAVFLGGFDVYQHYWGALSGHGDYGNPYLVYSPLRPVITVALPTVWLLLLISRSMRQWIGNSQPVGSANAG